MLLQLHGSIYTRVWKAGLVIGSYSCLLHLFFWELWPERRPEFENPFVVQSLSVLVSFSVCFRTNIAWSRFWEACDQVKLMHSKWGDAYSQIQAFINSAAKRSSKKKDQDTCAQLEHLKNETTHYFSLLSCVAIERLMRGDLRRMMLRRKQGASWSSQVVFRKDLRINDLTGSCELCVMRSLNFESFCTEPASKSVRLGSLRVGEENNTVSLGREGGTAGLKSRRRQPMSWVADRAEVDLKDNWQTPMLIIGEATRDELRMLQQSDDRISLVTFWINQLLTDSLNIVDTPPPIVSRVYQELSNGSLGYSQAEKLADIPFPFIFAQLLAIAMVFVALVAPISFSLITGHSWLGPVVSTLVIITFWSLNEMSKELENPFGSEANNVDIVDDHERFVCFLGEIYGGLLPPDRAYKLQQITESSQADDTFLAGGNKRADAIQETGNVNAPQHRVDPQSDSDNQPQNFGIQATRREASSVAKHRGHQVLLGDGFNSVVSSPK